MTEKVLVIDDDSKVLESLIRILKFSDISCEGETNPQIAIERFKADPADVIVVDYIYDAFPEITGLDVISEIRKIKPITRTILISGMIDHVDLDPSALTADLKAKIRCDYYLRKPVANDELVKTVRNALQDVIERSTDWKSIAEEYVQNQKIEPDQVRKLNESIKEHIIKSFDEKGEDEK